MVLHASGALAGSLPKCVNDNTVVTGIEGTYLSQAAVSPYSQTGGVCQMTQRQTVIQMWAVCK